MSIDINNINTLVAILSGLLSILGLLAHTLTKKLEDSSDFDGIINKTIFTQLSHTEKDPKGLIYQ